MVKAVGNLGCCRREATHQHIPLFVDGTLAEIVEQEEIGLPYLGQRSGTLPVVRERKNTLQGPDSIEKASLRQRTAAVIVKSVESSRIHKG